MATMEAELVSSVMAEQENHEYTTKHLPAFSHDNEIPFWFRVTRINIAVGLSIGFEDNTLSGRSWQVGCRSRPLKAERQVSGGLLPD